MFSANTFAKIKEVENKENYSVCKISISKKNKQTGKYETDFFAKCRFVGQAHLQRPMADQRIKITSCGVSNCFTKDDKLEFLKAPNYLVFGYELQEEGSHSPSAVFPTDEEDTELPF